MVRRALLASVALASIAWHTSRAQHQMMHTGSAAPSPPRAEGQAAFAAIKDVVAQLDADSTTDWAKVSIERLRQHLIDMDDVLMRADVSETPSDGGFTADVTGTGRTVGAIRRMLTDHAAMLGMEGRYRASATEIPGGVRLVVAVRDTGDARGVARLHGLGVAGLLTEGEHHAAHHLMIARGDANPHGR